MSSPSALHPPLEAQKREYNRFIIVQTDEGRTFEEVLNLPVESTQTEFFSLLMHMAIWVSDKTFLIIGPVAQQLDKYLWRHKAHYYDVEPEAEEESTIISTYILVAQ